MYVQCRRLLQHFSNGVLSWSLLKNALAYILHGSDCSLFHNCVGQEAPQCDEGTGADPTQPWVQSGHKTDQNRGFAALIF